MNDHPKNACTSHDWTASLEEGGVEVCAWPGCRAKREAAGSVADDAHVVMVVVEARRAA